MIIGVTGMLGSGKTTVARLMGKKLHYKVIDADRLAWRAFRSNSQEIKRIFETPDRKKLGKIVFGDKKKLLKLQGIIHPYVLSEMEKEAKKGGNVILDVPLLIESGTHKFADVIIVVRCAERVRIKRLLEKGFTLKQIRQRTRYQMPFKMKIRYADYIIDNSKSLSMTERRVGKILKIMKVMKTKAR